MTPKNPRSSASLCNGYGQKRSICLCTADKTFLTTKNHYWPVLMLVKIFSNGKIKEGKTCLAMFGSTDKHLFLRTKEKTFLPLYFHSKKNQTCIQGPSFSRSKDFDFVNFSLRGDCRDAALDPLYWISYKSGR